MKVIQITSSMENYRFTLDRSLELSKYIDVKWYVGWFKDKSFNYKLYCAEKHEIIVMGYPANIQKKLKGLLSQLLFIIRAAFVLRKEKHSVVIIHSSRFALLFPFIAPRHNYVMTLYTTSVSTSDLKNWFWDTWLRINTLPYHQFIVDEPKMKDSFRIDNNKKTYVFEWGMKPISKQNKEFSSIKMLYIGVLGRSRRIEDTLKGLKMFLDKYPDTKITYDIIGRAKPDEMQMMRDTIKSLKLDGVVFYHGYLSDEDIVKYFDECNIGVSYVPITSYYTNVTVTKTMEYLLSGIPVIATMTNWHKMYIKGINGVLINDTPVAFAEGLEHISKNLQHFNSHKIMENGKMWDLENSVRNNIIPLFQKIIDN